MEMEDRQFVESSSYLCESHALVAHHRLPKKAEGQTERDREAKKVVVVVVTVTVVMVTHD